MDAPGLRLKARESLKGNYWPAVAVAFVAAIFGALMVNGGSYSLNIEKRATDLFGDLPTIVKTYLMIAAGGAGALHSRWCGSAWLCPVPAETAGSGNPFRKGSIFTV